MKKLSGQPKSKPLTRKIAPVLVGVVLATTGCNIGQDLGVQQVGEPTVDDAGEPGADAGNEDAGAEDAGAADVDGGSSNDAG